MPAPPTQRSPCSVPRVLVPLNELLTLRQQPLSLCPCGDDSCVPWSTGGGQREVFTESTLMTLACLFQECNTHVTGDQILYHFFWALWATACVSGQTITYTSIILSMKEKWQWDWVINFRWCKPICIASNACCKLR